MIDGWHTIDRGSFMFIGDNDIYDKASDKNHGIQYRGKCEASWVEGDLVYRCADYECKALRFSQELYRNKPSADGLKSALKRDHQ